MCIFCCRCRWCCCFAVFAAAAAACCDVKNKKLFFFSFFFSVLFVVFRLSPPPSPIPPLFLFCFCFCFFVVKYCCDLFTLTGRSERNRNNDLRFSLQFIHMHPVWPGKIDFGILHIKGLFSPTDDALLHFSFLNVMWEGGARWFPHSIALTDDHVRTVRKTEGQAIGAVFRGALFITWRSKDRQLALFLAERCS